jgi:hypothetical protein
MNSSMTPDLSQLLEKMPKSALSTVVCGSFVTPFLQFLEYDQFSDIYQNFPTGNGDTAFSISIWDKIGTVSKAG